MARERILLVGESNPHSVDPRFALYPSPPGCAGWRLCRKVFGMDPSTYLDEFDRVNLVQGEWNWLKAREAASKLTHSWRVLLGRKVCTAIGVDYRPLKLVFMDGWVGLILPHPSGRCRAWNDASTADAARRGLEALRVARDHGGI